MSPMAPPKSAGPRGAINHDLDLQSIQQEDWLVGLVERINDKRYKLDPSIISELKMMSAHHTTPYRKKGSQVQPRLPVISGKDDLIVLQQENALCLAHRDRVTEILVRYTAIKFAIDEFWEYAESKLLENESFQKLTNAEARKAFITAVLQPLHTKRLAVKKTIAMCEILQEHLSHTHFTIKQHVEMGVAYLNFKSA